MGNDELASYLKDHMAGSVGAVDMLEHLIGSHEKEPVGEFCRELLQKVKADQAELEEMMDALNVSESAVRRTGAWITEKLSLAKLGWEGAGGVVQGFEALVLGITAKKLLWRVPAAPRRWANSTNRRPTHRVRGGRLWKRRKLEG